MVLFSFPPFITVEKDFSQVKAKVGSLENTHHQPGIFSSKIQNTVHLGWKKEMEGRKFIPIVEMLHV